VCAGGLAAQQLASLAGCFLQLSFPWLHAAVHPAGDVMPFETHNLQLNSGGEHPLHKKANSVLPTEHPPILETE
jgi:hypothetical protein